MTITFVYPIFSAWKLPQRVLDVAREQIKLTQFRVVPRSTTSAKRTVSLRWFFGVPTT